MNEQGSLWVGFEMFGEKAKRSVLLSRAAHTLELIREHLTNAYSADE